MAVSMWLRCCLNRYSGLVTHSQQNIFKIILKRGTYFFYEITVATEELLQLRFKSLYNISPNENLAWKSSDYSLTLAHYMKWETKTPKAGQDGMLLIWKGILVCAKWNWHTARFSYERQRRKIVAYQRKQRICCPQLFPLSRVYEDRWSKPGKCVTPRNFTWESKTA